MNELPEIPNPLTNGRIVSADTPIKVYLDSKGGENGEPRILSRSDLCEIAVCPSRWHKGYVEPDRRLPAVEFGSLFDCLLLQPNRFNEYYTMAPKEYTNSKKQVVPWTWKSSTCRDWREAEEAQGHLVCTQEDYDEAQQAAESLFANPDLGAQTKRMLEGAAKQVFIIAEYQDKETGVAVPVKCLTDIVPDAADAEFGKCLLDCKTASSAHPRIWQKAVFESNYHVQGAINLDCHQATGADRTDFRHLIVENFAPWEPARRFLISEYLTIGRLKYLTALRTYCRCVQEGYWPSYNDPSCLHIDGYEGVGPLPYMVNS